MITLSFIIVLFYNIEMMKSMERHVGTFESKGSEYRIEGQWYKANEVDEDKAKDIKKIEKLNTMLSSQGKLIRELYKKLEEKE